MTSFRDFKVNISHVYVAVLLACFKFGKERARA